VGRPAKKLFAQATNLQSLTSPHENLLINNENINFSIRSCRCERLTSEMIFIFSRVERIQANRTPKNYPKLYSVNAIFFCNSNKHFDFHFTQDSSATFSKV